MKKIILVLSFIFLMITSSQAAKIYYGDFHKVTYIRNYDGDTVTFNIPNAHPLIGKKINIRVAGIDTPERRGKCQKEKDLAMKAKLIVRNLLKDAKDISLINIQRGKYFRLIAVIIADNIDISKILLEQNLAVEYFGGKKTKDWCL